MKGIRPNLGHWFDWRKMSPQKAVSLVFVSTVVLLVVSYAIWHFGRLISPQLRLNEFNPTIILNTSDREASSVPPGYIPLPNTLDGGVPFYNYVIGSGPTQLSVTNGQLDHARLDLRLNYR